MAASCLSLFKVALVFWVSAHFTVPVFGSCAGLFAKYIDTASAAPSPKILPIHKSNNHPELREPSREIREEEFGTDRLREFAESLQATLRKTPGSGIAAPQVGVNEQIIVVKIKGKLVVAINPKLRPVSDTRWPSIESCLSMGHSLPSRYRKVEIEYRNVNGSSEKQVLSGFEAVLAQHEVDHLHGILMHQRSKRYFARWGLAAAWNLPYHLQTKYLSLLSAHESSRSDRKPFIKTWNKAIEALSKEDSLAANALKGDYGEVRPDELFEYHLLRFRSDSRDPEHLASQIAQWADNPSKELFALRDLSREGTGDSLAFYALARHFPESAHAHLHTLGWQKESSKNSRRVRIPKIGSEETQSYKMSSTESAIELYQYMRKYKILHTPDGCRATIEEDGKFYHIHGKHASIILEALKNYEAQSLPLAETKVRTTNGAVRLDASKPISFGIESELNLRENPEVLQDYRAANVPEWRWIQLSTEARLEAGKRIESRRREKDSVLYIRLSDAPTFLPRTLTCEANGNFEMNGFVFQDFTQFKNTLDFLRTRYGPNSVQGHVVHRNYHELTGVAGWVIFEADAAQLASFEKNYSRHEKDSTFIPGRTLSHHSLAPLGEGDRNTFLEFERRASIGLSIHGGGNSRLTYAPVLRGDKYKGGVGHELRQFHKRHKQLSEAASALSEHLSLSADFSAFQPYGRARLINNKLPRERCEEYEISVDFDAWQQFFNRVGEAISVQNPTRNGGAFPTERFYYPLRDWKNHPILDSLGNAKRTEAEERIARATRSYIEAIDRLVDTTDTTHRFHWSVIEELQIAAARWGAEVRLSQYFNEAREQHFKSRGARDPPKVSDFVEITEIEPGSEFYADYNWTWETFQNGRKYRLLKGNQFDSLEERDQSYYDFINSSIEFIYGDALPFGHSWIRVGGQLYSYSGNSRMSTTQVDYDIGKNKSGRIGFVFMVGQDAVLEHHRKIEDIYLSAIHHHLPTFDSYSPLVELVPIGGNVYKVHGGSHILGSNGAKIYGEIVEKEKGERYFRSNYGYEEKIQEAGERLYIQSYSCSTFVTKILIEMFGIQVAPMLGAKSLRDIMLLGNPEGTSPDVIIHY